MTAVVRLEEGREESLPSFFVGGKEGSLRAAGLQVRFGAVAALQGVDLTLSPGEQVAIVGPNGSGKSTLLLALKGLLQPAAGRVTLGDSPLCRSDPRVGLVLSNPEDQGVSPVVEDDVAFGLEASGCPPAVIRQRVAASLRAVEMGGLRRAPVHTLSGGQLQRVALASVLALGARHLLLDEATSMLSPWERDGLLLLLAKLTRAGLGLVTVTHEAEEVLWADRVLCLEGGSVAFRGTPSEFFSWEDCPLAQPVYGQMAQDLAGSGVASPPLRELCTWLQTGGGT